MNKKFTVTVISIDTVATGRNIKALCRANGIRIADLADALGISPQAVYGWLRGDKTPSYDNAKAIAEQLFHISVDELYVMCGEHSRTIEEDEKSSSIHFKGPTKGPFDFVA